MVKGSALGHISPCFIVENLARALKFYQRLGFEVRFIGPDADPFFAIVGRDSVQVFLKVVSESVGPQPNHTRHEWASLDAFVYLEDPDSLAAEFTSRGVDFWKKLQDYDDDGLRGFEVADADGYVLFFGRPK